MGKSAVVTTRLDADTLAALDAMAERHDRSRAWVAARAIRRAIEEEEAFLAFVQVGIDQADRGELVSQEEMEAWFEARLGRDAAA